MAEDDQYAMEVERLYAEAAQFRLRAIESQLALGFVLCTLAETEMRYRHFAEARKIVDKMRHATESIRVHLDERDVPKNAMTDLWQRLTQVASRVQQVEAQLCQVQGL